MLSGASLNHLEDLAIPDGGDLYIKGSSIAILHLPDGLDASAVMAVKVCVRSMRAFHVCVRLHSRSRFLDRTTRAPSRATRQIRPRALTERTHGCVERRASDRSSLSLQPSPPTFKPTTLRFADVHPHAAFLP